MGLEEALCKLKKLTLKVKKTKQNKKTQKNKQKQNKGLVVRQITDSHEVPSLLRCPAPCSVQLYSYMH